MVTLDHINYRNELIQELVAILIDDEYKAVKWLNQGSKSIQFMLTHMESAKIGEKLFNKFNDLCEAEIYHLAIPNGAFQQLRYIQKYDLGLLNQFHGFTGLIEDDVQLSLIIDNHYHLDGQLEISLALSINRDNIVIFDKWSTWKSKNSFKNTELEVNPRINNFLQRDQLILDLSNDAFSDFLKSLAELKEFLTKARDFTLNGETLKAVYLDLKDRNRSITSLKLSNENREKIKNDLKKVNKFIRERNQRVFSYIDFIRIIAKSPPQFYYNPQHEFEITTSRAYNSLLKKQKIFSYRNNSRFIYEEEQLHILQQVEPII